jgi:isoamylase
VRLLIVRRLLRDVEAEHERESLNQHLLEAIKAWHGVKLRKPDWNCQSHSIAFSAELKKEQQLLHFILNAYWEPLTLDLPPLNEESSGPWRRWIDTTLEPPHDIVAWQSAPPFTDQTYRAGPRSVVVLYAPFGGFR